MTRAARVIATVALVLAVAACGGSTPVAPRITDVRFTTAAAKECARTLPPLRPDIGDDDPKEALEIAPVVADRAEALAALTARLRKIPVTAEDRPAATDWLSDWDRYVEVGRRYSRALTGDDPRVQTSIATLGEGPQRRISAFARVNKMEACALDGVPLPKRDSPL